MLLGFFIYDLFIRNQEFLVQSYKVKTILLLGPWCCLPLVSPLFADQEVD